MTRICPACCGLDWHDFLVLGAERSLTSDQRIVPERLDKLICRSCGLVRNRTMLGGRRLDDYETLYALNTAGGEEHVYFGEDGQNTRSRAVFDWMLPYLPATPANVLEIGCGMGNLLDHLAAHFSGATVTGVEGSRHAADLARRRHSDVRRQFVGTGCRSLPVSDLVVAFGVAEHVEDLDGFLAAIRAACHAESTVIFCVPIQDQGGYDAFFSDHVWHFTIAQFRSTLSRRGFDVVTSDTASPIVRGFGMVVSRPGPASCGPPRDETPVQIANRDCWRALLADVDRRLRCFDGKTVALYGASEVSSLLMTYTDLGTLRIATCLDEDRGKIGRCKHGIPINHPDYFAEHPVDAVLLTVNPRYNDRIRAKLAPRGVPVLSLFE